MKIFKDTEEILSFFSIFIQIYYSLPHNLHEITRMDSRRLILLQSVNSPWTRVYVFFVTGIKQAKKHINGVQHLEQSSSLLLMFPHSAP